MSLENLPRPSSRQTQSPPAALRLRFHRHAEGIATLTEGQLAVSHDGWVLGANAVAIEWLGLRSDQINGVQLDAVFDLGRAEWTPWLHSGERTPRRLASRHRGFVWARVDSAPQAVESEATRLQALSRLAPSAPSAPLSAGPADQAAPAGPLATPPDTAQATPPEATRPHDALAALDLGDAAMERAPSWYKRRTQIWLTLFAFVLALAFNLDSFYIGSRLL